MLARTTLANLKFGNAIMQDVSVSAHLPFIRHVDDKTIKLEDDMYAVVVKFQGFPFQTAQVSKCNELAIVRNTWIKSLNDSRYAVYAHLIRRRISPQIGGSFENYFCAELDRRYMETLSRERMYVNELYWTVIRREFVGKVGAFDKIAALVDLRIDSKRSNEKHLLKELNDHVTQLVDQLAEFQPVVQRVVERNGAHYSEPVEFLSMLLTGGVHKTRRLARTGLSQYLPTTRITFGRSSMVYHGVTRDERRFGAMLAMREYPGSSGAGMLDNLLKVNGEFILSQSFDIIDKQPALERIALSERQVGSSDEAGGLLQRMLREAHDKISSGDSVLGNHHLSVLCLGAGANDEEAGQEMERCLLQAKSALQLTGAVILREDLNLEPSFWAQFPGNFRFRARGGPIMSENFVGFSSLYNYPIGKKEGNIWGPAIACLATPSRTVYYHNFHEGDVGSFTIFGGTGGGKTTFLNFMSSQAQRTSPRPSLIFFDRDNGAGVFIRAMDGQYETMRPGVKSGYNPAQMDATPENAECLKVILRHIVRPRNGGLLTPTQEDIIHDAVESIFQLPKHERRWMHIAQVLRGREAPHEDDLNSRFLSWNRGREWLFDNETDKFSASGGVVGFDMTKILEDDEIRPVALVYVFHRIQEYINVSRSMIFFDEGWRILQDHYTSQFLYAKFATIRKEHGLIGFGTQDVEQVVRANVASGLIVNTEKSIWLPNRDAGQDTHCRVFGLTPEEFQWVKTSPKQNREYLIKDKRGSVVVKLNMGGVPDLLRVLSGNKDLYEECERLRERFGPKAESWLPYYLANHQGG